MFSFCVGPFMPGAETVSTYVRSGRCHLVKCLLKMETFRGVAWFAIVSWKQGIENDNGKFSFFEMGYRK